jgi:hypothetical protein
MIPIVIEPKLYYFFWIYPDFLSFGIGLNAWLGIHKGGSRVALLYLNHPVVAHFTLSTR